MGLQRQRRLGGQQLEQERQPRPELTDHRGTQLADRIRGDALEERLGPATAVDPRREGRVGTHPELCLRPAGGRFAEQLGNGSRRAPGIGPHRVLQEIH